MALLWMLVQYSGIGNEYMDDALFFERQENCIETFQLLSIQYNPSGCFIGAAAYTDTTFLMTFLSEIVFGSRQNHLSKMLLIINCLVDVCLLQQPGGSEQLGQTSQQQTKLGN